MKQFFEKVLPTQGNICVVGMKGDVIRPKFSDNLDDALNHISGFDQGDFNTFFAPGTFEGYHSEPAKLSEGAVERTVEVLDRVLELVLDSRQTIIFDCSFNSSFR